MESQPRPANSTREANRSLVAAGADRLTLTSAERLAIIEKGRDQPLTLDAGMAEQLGGGHLEQVCPDCGRREAAHPYCSGCFLPLTDRPGLPKELGTRHRAGVGISEISDAAVVIVSEETGVVSLAVNGRLERHLDEEGLADRLLSLTRGKAEARPWWGEAREAGRKAGA